MIAGCALLPGLPKAGENTATDRLRANVEEADSATVSCKLILNAEDVKQKPIDIDYEDVFPILYESDKRKPLNTSAIARIFCRIQEGGNYDAWFYRKFGNDTNGCNHSIFLLWPRVDGDTAGDEVCSLLDLAGIINAWTLSDWSFLQDDGTWRNWDTFWDEETKTCNGFDPVSLTKCPYSLFCVTKVCFINRYDFILFVHVNGDKVNKIRMNGYCKDAEDMRFNRYTRFSDRDFSPADEFLSSEYFVACAKANDLDILRVEYFPVIDDEGRRDYR